jgi:molecular chaperone DnaJ
MDYNKNYYQELGIDKNATEEDIKKAYRKLAHQHHPDKNQGDKGSEAKFQTINEANSILSDSKSKQEYDQRSPHGNAYSPFQPFGGGGFPGGGFEFHFGGNAGDMFSQFFGSDSPFGGGGFNPFQRREEFMENLDINMNVTVNLKQIYLNENLNIQFKKFVSCDDCNGTGFDKQSHSDDCEICNGTGREHGQTCNYCKGDGKVYTGTCKTCNGEKIILKDAEVTMQNLSQLRNNIRNAHRGFGHQSKYYREKVGSLILNLIVDRNDKYEIVNGHELHQNLDIHFQDAIDGAEIIYTHIDDTTIKIKLPNKTKNGDIIRVKDKGLLMNEKQRNDLYLKINIIINYERI